MGYIALLFLLTSTIAWSSPAEEPEPSGVAILDSAQNLFGTRANFVANNIDSFFANQRADDELGRSSLRLTKTYEMREGSLPNNDNQIRFNLRLPDLEEKFHIRYVGIDGKESPEYLKKMKDKKRDPNIIRIIDKPTADTPWLFRSDAGINANIPPNLFVRSRARKSVQYGTYIHRFVEQIGWFSADGVVQETTYSVDKPITDSVLFRFNNTQDWNITYAKFDTSHGPSIFQRLSDDDALSYGLSMASIIKDSVWFVSNYRLSVNYRRNIYHNWIFFDVTPGLDFPKLASFKRNPFILFQLEALFGSSK